MPDPKDSAKVEDITEEQEPLEDETTAVPGEDEETEPEDEATSEEQDEEEEDELDEDDLYQIKLAAAQQGIAPATLKKLLDAGATDANVLKLLRADGQKPGRQAADDEGSGGKSKVPQQKRGSDDDSRKPIKFDRMDDDIDGADKFNKLVDHLERETERANRLEERLEAMTASFQQRAAADVEERVNALFDGPDAEEFRKLVGTTDKLSRKQEKNRTKVSELMVAFHKSGQNLPLKKLFRTALAGYFEDIRPASKSKQEAVQKREQMMLAPAGNRKTTDGPRKRLTPQERMQAAVRRNEEFDRKKGIQSA